MKIAASRADEFSHNPDDSVRAVLVYGPDDGLVRNRADALTKAVVDDPNDPFRVADVTASALRDVPSLIADEAAAIALTGGRRVVRFRDAPEAAAGALEAFLDDSPGDALVVVQASNLSSRSKLRKLFEDKKNAAAVPCYADDERALNQLIHSTLKGQGISVSMEAMDHLTANLGADRGLSLAELEKLALYVGPNSTISLDDAIASVGDSSALSINDVIFAAASGDGLTADRALTRSYAEGVNPVTILRALGRHLMRLQLVRATVDGGTPTDRAIKSLRPPVFFKLARQFRQQLGNWTSAKLTHALALVLEAERQCKSSGSPSKELCGRAILQISRLGAKRR